MADESTATAPKKNTSVNHVAEALKQLGGLVLFKTEGDRVRFFDHVTLAGGAENEDQTTAAQERHDAHVEATAEPTP
jgi:hypothetical protein